MTTKPQPLFRQFLAVATLGMGRLALSELSIGARPDVRRHIPPGSGLGMHGRSSSPDRPLRVGAQSSSMPSPGSAMPQPPQPPSGDPNTGWCPDPIRDCRPSDCQIAASRYTAGHGRAVYPACGDYSCEIAPPPCDCQVIGGNTLNSSEFPTGVPSNALWRIRIDSGDADFFVPYWLVLEAYETGAVPALAITGDVLETLLADSLSGRQPNMHRADPTNPSYGVASSGFSVRKDRTCVDWNRFASVEGQQLTLVGRNIREVNIHVFAVIWGLPAAVVGSPCA